MQMPVQTNAQTAFEPTAYEDHFVEIDGLRLHVQDYGSPGKPQMLCVHGGGANGHWYDFVAHGFTADYHVRTIDLRGHGDSEWDPSDPPNYDYSRHAADLHELTKKLRPERFRSGRAFHGRHGLERVCLDLPRSREGAHRRGFESCPVAGTDRQFSGGRRPTGARIYHAGRVHRELPGSPRRSTAPTEALRYIGKHSGRRFDDGLWRHKVDRRTYANREMMDSFALWDRIRIPALLMKAGDSIRMSYDAIAEIKARAPQVTMTLVPDADHHITLDNPTGFIRAAREFLAGIA